MTAARRSTVKSVVRAAPKRNGLGRPSHLQTGPGREMYPTSPLGEQVKGIPTGRDVEWEPLIDYRRYGVSETTIHGAVAWATGPTGKGKGAKPGKTVHSFGGNVLCYGRSMMKPL